MIPVNEAYNNALNDDNRNYQLQIKIYNTSNVLIKTLGNSDITSFTFNDACISKSAFSLGGTYAKNISFTLTNFDGHYDAIDMSNYVVEVRFTIAGDNTLYSKGTYIITSQDEDGDYVTIEAADHMLLFNKPFRDFCEAYFPSVPWTDESATWSNLTTGWLVYNMCAWLGVTCGTSSFVGSSESLSLDADHFKSFKSSNPTCRDVLGYCAELAAGYARIDRFGQLRIESFPDIILDGESSSWGGSFFQTDDMAAADPYIDGDNAEGGTFDYSTGDDVNGGSFTDYEYHVLGDSDSYTKVKKNFWYNGMIVTDKVNGNQATYNSGTSRVLKINNPLLALQNSTVTDRLWNGDTNHRGIKDIIIKPFEGNYMSDLSREAGDKCVFFDHRGRQYHSIILSYSWTYGNMESISAKVDEAEKNITIN